MKRSLSKIVSIFLLCVSILTLSACKAEEKSFILATTTSTYDSGLLDYLLPHFKEKTNIEVKVVPKGTGAAIELAKNGDADCLLVHAKSKEEAFIEEGFGLERFDVMYNDFVIIGPKGDPAGLKEKANSDPVQAFKLLSETGSTFVSRGDDSGTHTKEKAIWSEAGIEPSGKWYVSAGKGMGDVIQMSEEMEGYTLTDRATYLSMKDKLNLEVVTEKNDILYNQYGVIRLNPDKNDVKKAEADEFIQWILGEEAQKLIAEYGKEKFGQALFTPNAK